MKQRAITGLHEQTVPELRKALHDAHSELYNMRLEKSQFKLKNTSSLTMKRADIARIMTVLKLKEKTV